MAKLYFRYGSMNSGKTTQLLQVAHNYEERGMRVIIIKPERDEKGGNKIVSRIGAERQVDYQLEWFRSIREKVNEDIKEKGELHCILVDEVQFFDEDQIKEMWIISKKLDIPIITYGLRTDFKGQLFLPIRTLMAYADEMEELKTICRCGKKATMNGRKVEGTFVLEGEQVEIDNQEKIEYEALCGKCYIEKVLQK